MEVAVRLPTLQFSYIKGTSMKASVRGFDSGLHVSAASLNGIISMKLMNPTVCFALLALFLCAGCRHHYDVASILAPAASQKSDLITQIKAQRAYVESGTTTSSNIRDEIQDQLIGIANNDYENTKTSLQNGRNWNRFIGATVGTATSGVSAILLGVGVKTMLSTASTLTQSTSASVEKEFFNNATSSAIVAKMDQLRADQLVVITKRRTQDQTTDGAHVPYGLEQALVDVAQYDSAGRVHNALLAIDSDTASNKQDSEGNLQKAIDASLKQPPKQ